MIALFRRTCLMLFVLLAMVSMDALAQSGAQPDLPTGTIKKVSSKKMAKRMTRKKVRRRMAHKPGRKTVRKTVRKAAFRSKQVTGNLTGNTRTGVAVPTPKAAIPPAAEHLAGSVSAVMTEPVQYVFAGYVATADGTPARMWRSREYTVHSAYAYLGRMKFGETWEHVWVETTGNLLASAVTETSSEPMPDIAQMMERFPDGGQGVVVAGWDDFPPPAEPSVEVVEFADNQPGMTR